MEFIPRTCHRHNDRTNYPATHDASMQRTRRQSSANLSDTASLLPVSTQLCGDATVDRTPNAVQELYAFKPNMLLPDCDREHGSVTAICDPFGNSYGYSTANQADPSTKGYNPTFDLWSTAGLTTSRRNRHSHATVDQKLVAVGRFCETPSGNADLPMASDTDALQFREWLRTSLRSCAPRLRRGDWDFALRLSRSRTRGISLHRIRASGFAPD